MITAEKTVYAQIRTSCLRHMKGFQTDLTMHDRMWLRKNPDVPFLHWTRELGTDLAPLFPADHKGWPKAGERVRYLFGWASREHMLRHSSIIAQLRRKDGNSLVCLYFDGHCLQEIDADKAVEIASEYERIVLKAWGSNRCLCGSCRNVS